MTLTLGLKLPATNLAGWNQCPPVFLPMEERTQLPEFDFVVAWRISFSRLLHEYLITCPPPTQPSLPFGNQPPNLPQASPSDGTVERLKKQASSPLPKTTIILISRKVSSAPVFPVATDRPIARRASSRRPVGSSTLGANESRWRSPSHSSAVSISPTQLAKY